MKSFREDLEITSIDYNRNGTITIRGTIYEIEPFVQSYMLIGESEAISLWYENAEYEKSKIFINQ